MNNQNAHRQFMIEIGDYVNRIIATLPFMEDYKPGNKIKWDTRFIYDYARAKAADAFVMALNSGIPGLNSPLEAPNLKEAAFEPFIDYFGDRWFEPFVEPTFPPFQIPAGDFTPRQISDMQTDYKHECKAKISKARKDHGVRTRTKLREILSDIDRNLEHVFQDLENSIYEKIGRPTYDLWCTTVDAESGNLYCRLVGDFRILEWEADHLDVDGVYLHAVDRRILNDDELEALTSDVVQKALASVYASSTPIKDEVVTVIGWNDENKFQFSRPTVKVMLENLGAKVLTGMSSETTILALSHPDDLTPEEFETYKKFTETPGTIITDDSLIQFFAKKKTSRS